MGVIARFKDIMSANINALLDRCENPAKMIDEYLRKLTEDLAEVKKETASVMAEETRAKRLLDENQADAAKYAGLAQKAIAAGNDEDAKIFIAKKQSIEAAGTDLQKTYDIAHDNAQKMRAMHDKLTNDISALEARRANVKAKVAVAKTQDRMNQINSSMDSASSSMQAFERMEAKADRMLDEANAMSQLNEKPVDAAAEAEKRYTGVNDQSVDDELAKMKAEMGL